MGIKSVRAGDKAEAAFEKHMKRRRAFAHRLPDPSKVPTINGRRVKLPAQPADYVVCLDGVMMYAEVKSSANKTVFPFQMLRDSQITGAKECVRTKCPYLFYIHSSYNDLWYCVPGSVLLNRIKKGDKSMPWKDFDKYTINL